MRMPAIRFNVAVSVLASGFILAMVILITVFSLRRLHLQNCHAKYTLINPLYRCAGETAQPQKEYEAFGDELQQLIDELNKEKNIDHISIYFRDLENGPWFGIEEEELFSAASLLKVPIMITLFAEAQKNPAILKQEVGYQGEFSEIRNVFDSQKTIIAGNYYTFDELTRRMIVYSDNTSKELIKAYLVSLYPGRDLLAHTYQDLGILNEADLETRLTVKAYASMFRLLYNGTYLNKSMSQKALDLLRQVEFKDGLAAGVPAHIPVAHKFGIREDATDIKQLHDCGIVYHAQTPYLLCIMTRGNDLSILATIIADLSKLVYDEVTARAVQSAD
jgi:beta-lactamase class A